MSSPTKSTAERCSLVKRAYRPRLPLFHCKDFCSQNSDLTGIVLGWTGVYKRAFSHAHNNIASKKDSARI